MSYRFHNHKNLGKQAIALLLEQNRKAQQCLEQFETDSAGAVHCARRSFKSSRSLLHLVRDANPYLFAVENSFFSEVSDRLAAARDQDAMHEALERLDRLHTAGHALAATAVRSWFEKLQHEKRSPQTDNRVAVYAAMQSLHESESRLELAKLPGLNASHLLARLGLTRVEFRHRYLDAFMHPSAAAFHDWRKIAQRLHHQLHLCKKLDGQTSRQQRKQIKVIGDTLGQHQDVVLIQNTFHAHSDNLSPEQRKTIGSALERWMEIYRTQAWEQMLEFLGADLPSTDNNRVDPPHLKAV